MITYRTNRTNERTSVGYVRCNERLRTNERSNVPTNERSLRTIIRYERTIRTKRTTRDDTFVRTYRIDTFASHVASTNDTGRGVTLCERTNVRTPVRTFVRTNVRTNESLTNERSNSNERIRSFERSFVRTCERFESNRERIERTNRSFVTNEFVPSFERTSNESNVRSNCFHSNLTSFFHRTNCNERTTFYWFIFISFHKHAR